MLILYTEVKKFEKTLTQEFVKASPQGIKKLDNLLTLLELTKIVINESIHYE